MAGPSVGPIIGPGIDEELRVRSLVGSAVGPVVANLLIGISTDVGPITGFSVLNSWAVVGTKPVGGTSDVGRLVGIVLGRIMGSRLVFGLSSVTATGDKVGLDCTASIDK
jgi:hypothetical protein